MIHADRSTRSLLYRLQMSSVDKLKCYFTFTVAASLLLLCYFSLKSNIGMPPLENASIENLDESKAGILNPGCVSRKLRDYKPNVTKSSALYHHPNIVHYVMWIIPHQIRSSMWVIPHQIWSSMCVFPYQIRSST